MTEPTETSSNRLKMLLHRRGMWQHLLGPASSVVFHLVLLWTLGQIGLFAVPGQYRDDPLQISIYQQPLVRPMKEMETDSAKSIQESVPIDIASEVDLPDFVTEDIGNSPFQASVAGSLESASMLDGSMRFRDGLGTNDIVSMTRTAVRKRGYLQATGSLADQLRRHIAKDGNILLIWLIDSSGSMKDDREEIQRRVENIYKRAVPNNAERLQMAVVEYGVDATILQQPTMDFRKIRSGFARVGTAGGKENCMAALRFASICFPDNPRKKIIVLVTDEPGDDDNEVEETLRRLLINRVTLYVIGRESVFSRRVGFEFFSDGGKTVKRVTSLGPESVRPEIPTEGDALLAHDIRVLSGFGMYAQSWLVGLTGGQLYLLDNADSATDGRRVSRVQYDWNRIKDFRPELCSPAEYRRRTATSPLRKALLQAEQEWRTLPELPWQIRNKNDKNRALQIAQRKLNVCNNLLVRLRDVRRKPLEVAAKRWRANCDLAIAQFAVARFNITQYIDTVEKWNSASTNRRVRVKRDYGWKGTPPPTARDALIELGVVTDLYGGTPWSEVAKEMSKLWRYRLVPVSQREARRE